MKRPLSIILLATLLAVPRFFTHGAEPPGVGDIPGSEEDAIRLNGYALLHELLGKQKNVDKLLLIKLESDLLEDLINRIARLCGEAESRLETFAKVDEKIDFSLTMLPPGEVAVRAAIAETKKSRLLEPFNSDFEVELLRTQADALSYAWHLALVIAENESDEPRAAYLKEFADRMKSLYREVHALIHERLNG